MDGEIRGGVRPWSSTPVPVKRLDSGSLWATDGHRGRQEAFDLALARAYASRAYASRKEPRADDLPRSHYLRPGPDERPAMRPQPSSDREARSRGARNVSRSRRPLA